MNISKHKNIVLSVLLLFTFSNELFSQKIEPKTRVTEPDHTISSKIMGKDYQLYISFPRSYSTKDTISYPVLYVLDGALFFSAFQSSQGILSFGSEIEDVIIVGIGSGLDFPSWMINRNYDYTPTPSTDADGERKEEKLYGFPDGSLKSGGAIKFLNCIKTEIIPFVDKNYKTNNDRGISGHSLGGLFTAYCFINSDGYFTRFGINSPSLWWNKEELLNQAVTEIEYQNDNKVEWNIPPTKVFISAGKLEGSSMLPTIVKLSTHLEDLGSDKIDLEWYIFEKETHLSVISANMCRTISVLYGKE